MRHPRERSIHIHLLSFIAAALVVIPLGFFARPAWTSPVGISSYSGLISEEQTIRIAVELYRVRYGKMPDFTRGWDDLMATGLLNYEPVYYLGEPRVRHPIALSRAEVHTVADAGWIYEARQNRWLGVVSADYARWFPAWEDFADRVVVVPNAPIRSVADLFRPLSRQRPVAIGVLTVLVILVLSRGVSRIAELSARLDFLRQWPEADALLLATAVLPTLVWQTTWPINLYGVPEIGHQYSHRMHFNIGLLLVPLIVLVSFTILRRLVILSMADRRRLAVLHRSAKHRCPSCGYDMRANRSRCSECGAVADRRAVRQRRPRRDLMLGIPARTRGLRRRVCPPI